MKKLSLVLLAAGLFSSSAMAASVTYTIDPHHSFVRFSYVHHGLSTQIQRFDQTRGVVFLDMEAQKGKVEAAIKTASFSSATQELDEKMRTSEFFDSAKYPEATFESSKINFKDGKPVSVDGTITIKGISKPLTLTVDRFAQVKEDSMTHKPAIGVDASGVIKSSDFGLDKFAKGLGDDMHLNISVEAHGE